MTPLIDMVFLTLLFFMVNAVLSINPAIRVDLPRARSSLGAVGRDVVVTVQADGGGFVDDRRVVADTFAVGGRLLSGLAVNSCSLSSTFSQRGASV